MSIFKTVSKRIGAVGVTVVIVSSGFFAVGGAGASTDIITGCGSLSFVSVCGNPQYVANQLGTDEVNYVKTVYLWTALQQAAVYSNIVNDINIVAGLGKGLPASEQSQIVSDLSTTRTYFDYIKYSLEVYDPGFNANGIAQAFFNGICLWLAGDCVGGF